MFVTLGRRKKLQFLFCYHVNDMKCPYCHKMTTEESKLCVHCGKNVQSRSKLTQEYKKSKDCPVCRIPMRIMTVAQIELDSCPRCSGFWFDKREMNQFEKSISPGNNADKILAALDDNSSSHETVERGTYIKCPICNQLMARKNYHEISGVILDQCFEHGIWAEREDFVKIVDFIISGDIGDLIEKSLRKQHQEVLKKIHSLESTQSAMQANINRNIRVSRTHLILDFLGFT